MLSSLRNRTLVVAVLVVAAVLAFPAFAAAGQASTGTYIATTGGSAATASGATAGGRGRASGSTASTSGGTVTIDLGSYSTQSEVDALKAANDNLDAFLKQLSSYSHGSVKIGNQSFKINFAYSTQTGSEYQIFLVSATPLTTSQTGPQGRSATGAAGGYIRLTVNANGDGTGMMYSSTQVVINNNGSVEARAGGSTATQLTTVDRQ